MKFFYLLPLCFLLASCSLLRTEQIGSSESDNSGKRLIENEATDVHIEDSLPGEGSRSAQSANSNSRLFSEYGIELSWDIPDEPVDSFVLYSGTSEDNMETETELTVDQLKSTADGRYLYVFRPVDPNQPVFVAIAAKRGNEISGKSLPQEYAPDPKFSVAD